MNFKSEKSETYIKYFVIIEYIISGGQKVIYQPGKDFNKISQAISFINKKKQEMKNLPEIYKDYKIYVKRIKTTTDDFLVIEGEQ